MTQARCSCICPKEISLDIKTDITKLSGWNSEVQIQTSRTNRDCCVVHAYRRGDGDRRWDEGVGVSRGLEIVDEVSFEVATDLENRLGSRKAEEPLVLGIEWNIVEACGGNAVFGKCRVGPRCLSHLRRRRSLSRRLRTLYGSLLVGRRGCRGRGCRGRGSLRRSAAVQLAKPRF